MVTTEIAQLNRECNAWRETLRSYRDEFGQLKNRLQDVAGRQTKRDVLLEVEQLDNQLHIQLINIHDLRHAIKTHCRQIETGIAGNDGNLPDELLGYHENLYDEYQSLDHTLQGLRTEFEHFVSRTR